MGHTYDRGAYVLANLFFIQAGEEGVLVQRQLDQRALFLRLVRDDLACG